MEKGWLQWNYSNGPQEFLSTGPGFMEDNFPIWMGMEDGSCEVMGVGVTDETSQSLLSPSALWPWGQGPML